MSGVIFDRKWDINSREDYEKAMETLKRDDFIAEMSDSYAITCSERREVRKQRLEIMEQVKRKAYIWIELTEEQQEKILAEFPGKSEHGRCIDYRQEAYHDVNVFEDGYEERFYIGD